MGLCPRQSLPFTEDTLKTVLVTLYVAAYLLYFLRSIDAKE